MEEILVKENRFASESLLSFISRDINTTIEICDNDEAYNSFITSKYPEVSKIKYKYNYEDNGIIPTKKELYKLENNSEV